MEKKYTLKQCKEDMIRMWEWLVENPGKSKNNFLDSLSEKEDEYFSNLHNLCGCCNYVLKDEWDDPICEFCPVVWNEDDKSRKNTCYADESPYSDWCNAVGECEEDARKAALTILNLARAIKLEGE